MYIKNVKGNYDWDNVMNPMGVNVRVDHLKDIEQKGNFEVTVLFVLSGEATLSVENDSYNMSKNSVIVVNSEKAYSLRVKEGGLICQVLIDTQLINDNLGNGLLLFWCNSTIENGENYSRLKDILRDIVAKKYGNSGKDDFGLLSDYYKLMDVLTKEFLIDHDDVRYKNAMDDGCERMQQIIAYVQKNYVQDISLNEMAEKFYLSNAYLSRFFKKNMGLNFKDYINSVRLYHAVNDLLGTDKNITRIAMENGFPSVHRFNQVFREKYEMSPSSYKEQHINNYRNAGIETIVSDESVIEDINEYILQEEELKNRGGKKTISQQVNVSIYRPVHKNWNRIINIGTIDDVVQGQIQNDLLKINRELEFTYIRFWNMFNNFSCEENQYYNFDRIERVLEFLIENNMKPFMVIGGKGRSILRTIDSAVVNQDDSSNDFLQNIDAWKNLLNQFCKYLKETFGELEVSTWVFEIRKPKPWDYFAGRDEKEKFAEWFVCTFKILKKYFPEVMVGGCEFDVNYGEHSIPDIEEMMDLYKFNGIVPDFHSLSIYPYEKHQLSMKEEYLKETILAGKKLFTLHGFGFVPIMVTEWSNTLSCRNILNDSPYKGAYIVQNLTMNTDIADKIVYWTGTDIWAEYDDTRDILYGGVGILSKHSIPKPSYFAFYFLNRLFKNQIKCTRNYCITTDGKNNYRILCNNMKHITMAHHLDESGLAKTKPKDLEECFQDLEALSLNFELQNLVEGEYVIRKREVSDKHGSILHEWGNLDYCSPVKREDLEYLNKTCQPKLTIQRIKSVGGTMSLKVNLRANGFEYIEIQHKED